MHCRKIRVPGGVAIICGGGRLTMAEKQLIESQTKLIERTKKAAQFHRELAAECDKAGLPVLAREHDYVAT